MKYKDNLEWLVYHSLDLEDPIISYNRGMELLKLNIYQMNKWYKNYSLEKYNKKYRRYCFFRYAGLRRAMLRKTWNSVKCFFLDHEYHGHIGLCEGEPKSYISCKRCGKKLEKPIK